MHLFNANMNTMMSLPEKAIPICKKTGIIVLILVLSGCGGPAPGLDERLASADALVVSGDLAGGIQELEKLNQSFPGRVDVLEPLAYAYMEKGDSVLAGFTFNQIAGLAEGLPEYHLYAAEAFRHANDLAAASDEMRAYIGKRPEDTTVWRQLGELEKQRGRRSDALDAFLSADRIEPTGDGRLQIGHLYLAAGNLPQAQAWFARALNSADAPRQDSMFGLFETAIRAQRWSDAEAIMRELDSDYPGFLSSSRLAKAREDLIEWRTRQDAAKAAAEAIARQPVVEEEEQPAEEETAEAAEEEVAVVPEVEAAEEPESLTAGTEVEVPEVEEAAAEAPVRVTDSLQKARDARDRNEFTEAVRLYRQALARDPQRSDLWLEMSEVALQAGQGGWAQAAASEAMRLDPESASPALQYLKVTRDRLEPENWVVEVENMYRKYPRSPEIILTLARAYRTLRRDERGARMMYQRYLELVPQGSPAYQQVRDEMGG